jgi:hypothetical protein
LSILVVQVFVTMIHRAVFTLVLAPAVMLAQSKPSAPAAASGLEFPVRMRQNVEAGKTPVGTRVQASLDLATLVSGVVIPEGAILSGEVIESAAKSAAGPSRLAIRMDTAEWKKGAAPVSLTLPSKVYLTAWHYPPELATPEDAPAMTDAARHRGQYRGGAAPYPDPNTSASPPYSHGNTGKTPELAPGGPSATVSQHRMLMKNVESVRQSDGLVTLISKRSNIKLDKSTTYVLATGELLAMR